LESTGYDYVALWFSKVGVADGVVAADFVFSAAGSAGLGFSALQNFLNMMSFE
jgi:hypothetical protein